MSVNNPLIKAIKGHTFKLFEESQDKGSVTDSSPNLVQFCDKLEEIYHNGFINLPQNNSSYFLNKKYDLFSVLSLAPIRNFTYENCIDLVKKARNIKNSSGRFRLLIRACLARKCIQIPLENLINSKRKYEFYHVNSIVGDEILSQILLSVLLQVTKICFKLDLGNCAFLDVTWEMPIISRLELVPCDNLGLAISFYGDKAVVVHVGPNSVAAENDQICIGDVLDGLNGIYIDAHSKGRLNTIFKLNRGRPVQLVIIKALLNDGQFYGPIKELLQNLQIFDKVKDRITDQQQSQTENISKDFAKISFQKPGYAALYLGKVDVGDKGNVQQIDRAIKASLRSNFGYDNLTYEQSTIPVIIEIGEMEIKVINVESGELIMKHSFMQISSCGSIPQAPNYIAYIAGDDNCEVASKFVCHIFSVKKPEDPCTILQSIGQGFHRTHFAV